MLGYEHSCNNKADNIRKVVPMNKNKVTQKRGKPENHGHVESEPVGLHGMSDATVRVVIDRHASQNLGEAYNIRGIEDKGRYYVVKLIRSDGGVIDRLLVDKQSGKVSSLEGKIRGKK